MIETEGLTKTYRYRGETNVAVEPLSIKVGAGEILGLLGPNGAGKTTTVRMLATLTRPSEGTAQVAGHDISRNADAVRAHIGYVPQRGSLLDESLIGEELAFQGLAFGQSRDTALAHGRELLAVLNAEDTLMKRAGKLSGGQRRRAEIALGLINTPSIAFLDEPTVGLDPQSRENLWEHIAEIRSRWGTTIVVTTHYLEEVQRLADRIIIMDKGIVVADDTTAELSRRFAIDVVNVITESPVSVELLEEISSVENVDRASVTPEGLEVSIREGRCTLPQVLDRLHSHAAEVRELEIVQGGLNDAFFSLTGRQLHE